MNGRRTDWRGAWLAVAGACVLAASAAEPLKAHIKTPTLDQDIELAGRGADRFLLYRAGAGEIGIPPRDVLALDFLFDREKLNVGKLYDEGNYTAVAKILREALEPTLPYLDLSTNAQAYVKTWIKAMYWDGQYADTARQADVIYYLLKNEDLQREIGLYRTAALIPQGRTNEIAGLLKKLQPPNATNDEMAVWWYATAQFQISQNQFKPAQESIARLVAFRPKDFEWMPAGLYLSAQLYGRAKHPDVGKQITQELRTVYPKSRWATMTAKLDAALEQMPQEEPEQPKDKP